MLTNLSDEILSEYSDDEVAEYIRDYFGGNEPEAGAIAYYIGAMRMPPDLRSDVFRLFRSAPLLCNECGAPSCIHGYPDD